jgi:1-deoxy-D-xylulose-5-phosphate synthase
VLNGGIGSRISQALRHAGARATTREIAIPVRFLEHGSVAQVRAAAGLSVPDIGRRIVEWCAMTCGEQGEDIATTRNDIDVTGE